MKLPVLILLSLLGSSPVADTQSSAASIATTHVSQEQAARARFDGLVEDRRRAEFERQQALDKLAKHAFESSPPASIMAAVENASARRDRLDSKLQSLNILHGFEIPDLGPGLTLREQRSGELFARAREGLVQVRADAALGIARSLPAEAPLPHAVARGRAEGGRP